MSSLTANRNGADDALTGLAFAVLRRTPPADTLSVLRALLADKLGAAAVELHLVNYTLSALHLLTDRALVGPAARPSAASPRFSQPVEGSLLGVVFTSQQPAVEARPEGTAVHVPVTVRSQRLGVLTAVLAACPEEEEHRVGQLQAVAEVVAHMVIEGGRSSDVFEVDQRSSRFTVAAEMQWQLLPGRALATAAFALAGQLEPASSVGGDAFDWSADANTLTVGVLDADGYGESAALTSTLAVSALRNARRAEVALAEQASLADQAVYAQFGGQRHVSALLLAIDLDRGAVQAIDAGSPALLRWRDGTAERLTLDAQLPLGMFDGTLYEPQPLHLQPGDRLLVATSGALAAQHPDGEPFGEHRLLDGLTATRDLGPGETVRQLVAAVLGHHGNDLPEDATLLCLDWFGD